METMKRRELSKNLKINYEGPPANTEGASQCSMVGSTTDRILNGYLEVSSTISQSISYLYRIDKCKSLSFVSKVRPSKVQFHFITQASLMEIAAYSIQCTKLLQFSLGWAARWTVPSLGGCLPSTNLEALELPRPDLLPGAA